MIRAVFLGDPHVTDDDEVRRVLEAIVDRVVPLRPSLTLVAGDLYGTHVVPCLPTPAQRGVFEPALRRLAGAAPVVVLGGNHDHLPTLERLGDLGGFYPVIPIPGAYADRIWTDDGPVDLYALAYPRRAWLARDLDVGGNALDRAVSETMVGLLRSYGAEARARETSDPAEAVLALGHWLVAGAVVGNGEVLTSGEPALPRSEVEDLPVDFGGVGHIHAAQEIARRWRYLGSLRATDFGDRFAKVFFVVDIGDEDDHPPIGVEPLVVYEGDGRRTVRVYALPTGADRRVTLDYRFGAVGSGVGWRERPTDAALAEVAGARVRARLSVAEDLVGTAPWGEEVDRLRALGAVDVVEERRLEVADRIRAPALLAAETLEAKLLAWVGTQAIRPPAEDLDAALGFLRELQEDGDEAIDARTLAVAGELAPRRPSTATR